MKIYELKDLYGKKVYDAAKTNQVAQGNKSNDQLEVSASSTKGNFNWASAKEGSAFWDQIATHNITKAKKLQPHLFDIEKWSVGSYVVITDKFPSSSLVNNSNN